MSVLVTLLLALAVTGCTTKKAAGRPVTAQPRAGASAAATSGAVTNHARNATPESALVGTVALVNPSARFVVLNFPFGKMARVDQRLQLYRRGSKVGEVKVTGPERGSNIVADLIAGEAEVGDEARSQ